jgi:hypothetical protein
VHIRQIIQDQLDLRPMFPLKRLPSAKQLDFTSRRRLPRVRLELGFALLLQPRSSLRGSLVDLFRDVPGLVQQVDIIIIRVGTGIKIRIGRLFRGGRPEEPLSRWLALLVRVLVLLLISLLLLRPLDLFLFLDTRQEPFLKLLSGLGREPRFEEGIQEDPDDERKKGGCERQDQVDLNSRMPNE